MIKVRKVEIGKGIPKICAPIVERTQDAILEMAENIYASSADMAEWRVDFYEDCGDTKAVEETISLLRSVLGDKPLMFTFRTLSEGGEKSISYNEYSRLLKNVAASGDADMVDVEVYRSENIGELIEELGKSVVVIGSYHDFDKTPETSEIVEKILYMNSVGADIPKIAVMPQTRKDVIRLMEATLEAREILGGRPVITMSMSGMGLVSRIAAENTGSAVTFGCIGKPSAPGQIEVSELKNVLAVLHDNSEENDEMIKLKEHIFMIGFMGVGKTSTSRALSHKLGISEIDTDAMIVEKEGCSIPEIFEKKGEAYFRSVETGILDDIADMEPCIVSCGGGMVMRDENVEKMKKIGKIILLSAEPETIYSHVKDSTNRPLLNGNMNVPYIKKLMDERQPKYLAALDIEIVTDGLMPKQVADKIIEVLA